MAAAAEHEAGARSRRPVRFLDEGEPGWRPFVFFGGLGTDLDAFYETEFARATRERLRLRAIGVERNGFGMTAFDPTLGYEEAVDDVLDVLADRRVERFAVVAISGGAPFAAALCARVPARVLSLHLAAAAAGPRTVRCGTARVLYGDPRQLAADPALAHEWELLGRVPLPDLTALSAPAYLYWGAGDDIVPPEHVTEWRRVLGEVAALRSYPGQGHGAPYRHWEPILLDVAGLGTLKRDPPAHELETEPDPT